jgi:hypothetical protein
MSPNWYLIKYPVCNHSSDRCLKVSMFAAFGSKSHSSFKAWSNNYIQNVKANLYLCLIATHHEDVWRSESTASVIQNLSTRSHPSPFTPGERVQMLMGLKISWTSHQVWTLLAQEEFLVPPGHWITIPSSSLQPTSCTAWGIPVHCIIFEVSKTTLSCFTVEGRHLTAISWYNNHVL